MEIFSTFLPFVQGIHCKSLCKQWCDWWFETQPCPLWITVMHNCRASLWQIMLKCIVNSSVWDMLLEQLLTHEICCLSNCPHISTNSDHSLLKCYRQESFEKLSNFINFHNHPTRPFPCLTVGKVLLKLYRSSLRYNKENNHKSWNLVMSKTNTRLYYNNLTLNKSMHGLWLAFIVMIYQNV